MSGLETPALTTTDFAVQQYLGANTISASLGYITLSVFVFWVVFNATLYVIRKSCDDNDLKKSQPSKDDKINQRVALACGMTASAIMIFLLFF